MSKAMTRRSFRIVKFTPLLCQTLRPEFPRSSTTPIHSNPNCPNPPFPQRPTADHEDNMQVLVEANVEANSLSEGRCTLNSCVRSGSPPFVYVCLYLFVFVLFFCALGDTNQWAISFFPLLLATSHIRC
jgi:hypothetical protein